MHWSTQNQEVMVIVFNATFNNISVISCSQFYLWGKPPTCRKLDTLYHIMLYEVRLAFIGIRTHNVNHDQHWLPPPPLLPAATHTHNKIVNNVMNKRIAQTSPVNQIQFNFEFNVWNIFKNWMHFFVVLLAYNSVDRSTFCMKHASKTTKKCIQFL